jgi:type II secretory pathway pseudopilin PulG
MRTFLARSTRNTTAFTIIEMLVVIGILSVIIVSLLIVLNPVDAQRRSRDTKRLKDVYTMQALLTQYIDEGGSFTACTTATPCESDATANNEAAPCSGSGNWIGGIDVCKYTRTVPVDPLNATQARCVTGTGTSSETCDMFYRVAVAGRSFEINVKMESSNNELKVTGDNGDSAAWYENFSSANNLMTN